MRADVNSSVLEWRRPTDQDQGPNSRHRKPSTREGNRGNRGGRGRGRGGNSGGPPRKDSTSTTQDTVAPPPKVVVNPPSATNTPAEPSPTPKSDSRPQPMTRNSMTISEDSTSILPQTSARPPNRRRRSQQGRRPSVSSNNQSKHLNVQTLSRKASTEPSSPNPAKDLPPHIATSPSTTPAAELKSDLDAFVERVRAVAMDRPHTPGSHIDWADDDDSLPDLNDWGYAGEVVTSVQPEEPQTSIPPILEDAPLETIIPEVRIEGEPSRDAQPGPVSGDTPPTHKVLKTRSKRGGRMRGDSRTHQIPQASNMTDSVSQDPTVSPIQTASATVIPQANKPQGAKRQHPNQGSRNSQGRANSKDSGNGGGRQRGRNGVVVASPMRNSFAAKPGPTADDSPSAKLQAPARGPDIVEHVDNPPAQSDSKPAESQGGAPLDERRQGEKPADTGRKPDAIDLNPNPAVRNDTPLLEPIDDDIKTSSHRNQRKRNSYNPSHSRSHTYGGRTQSGPQPPGSASTPNFPQDSSDTNPSPPALRNSRPSNLGQFPGMRSSGLGPAPQSGGFERHNRNHSSPPGVGGTTRPSHYSSRPMLTGGAFSLLAKSLPGSPRKEPPSDS